MIPNLKLYLYAAVAVAIFSSGAWISYSIMSGRLASKELAYEHERTKSAEAARKAEQAARETEQNWILTVNRIAAEADAEAVARQHAITALRATNGQLQQRIAALTNPGGSASDSPSAADYLRKRLEALGPLVGELDSFAGEVSTVADTLRDELALCRNYVRAIQ